MDEVKNRTSVPLLRSGGVARQQRKSLTSVWQLTSSQYSQMPGDRQASRHLIRSFAPASIHANCAQRTIYDWPEAPCEDVALHPGQPKPKVQAERGGDPSKNSCRRRGSSRQEGIVTAKTGLTSMKDKNLKVHAGSFIVCKRYYDKGERGMANPTCK